MALPRIFGALQRIREPGAAAVRSLADTVAERDLPVAITGQGATNWCWAATALGVAAFYTGRNRPQCGFVAEALAVAGDDLCCGDPQHARCNRQWYLHSALKLVDCFDRYEDGAAGFAATRAEIDAGRPLGVRVEWTRGTARRGGHFVVVSGWSTSAGGAHYLNIRDPWGPAIELVPVAEAETAYGVNDGRWTHSFFTRPPGDGPLGGGGDADHRPELLGGG